MRTSRGTTLRRLAAVLGALLGAMTAAACHGKDAGPVARSLAPATQSRPRDAGAGPASAPASAPAAACRTVRDPGVIGSAGWTGSKQCAAGARRWAEVPDQDRDCREDSDCVLLEAHTCFRLAVRRAAADRYRGQTPCPHPTAGMCLARRHQAVCRASCCTVVPR